MRPTKMGPARAENLLRKFRAIRRTVAMLIASKWPWQFVQQRTPAPICSETRLIRPWENSRATRSIAAGAGYARMVTAWVAELFAPVPGLSPSAEHPFPVLGQLGIDRPGA